MSNLLTALHAGSVVALGLALFLVGHLLLRSLLRPARLGVELFEKDNLAVGVAVAGYDLGLVLSFGSALMGESRGWGRDVLDILGHGSACVAIYYACGWVGRLVVIGRLGLVRELTEDRNLGVGFVLGAYLIASGLLIHGVTSGAGGGWVEAAAFFALAQAVLLLVGPVYGRIAGYDLRAALTADNAAAGLAYGGGILGIGIVLAEVLSSDFVGWRGSLVGFGAYAAGGLVALPLVRVVAGLVLAPGVNLGREIVGQDAGPNLAAGLLEAVSYVATGLLVAWSLG